MNCPNCGEAMTFVEDAGPDTAPWVSPSCARAYWPSELARNARLAWDRETRSFNLAKVPGLVAAREADRREHNRTVVERSRANG